jgi:hypothetical protein
MPTTPRTKTSKDTIASIREAPDWRDGGEKPDFIISNVKNTMWVRTSGARGAEIGWFENTDTTCGVDTDRQVSGGEIVLDQDKGWLVGGSYAAPAVKREIGSSSP